MTTDDPSYTEREKAALESLVEPRPLAESRIAVTLQQARRDVSFLRRHRVVVRVAAALMFTVMLSAGFWHWSGINSKRDLSYARGIKVLLEAKDYPFDTREAAMGRVFTVMNTVITKLEKAGEMSPLLRDGLRVGFVRPPTPGYYSGPFEVIVDKIGVTPLQEGEQVELLRALVAGADAIRALPTVDPDHGVPVAMCAKRLRRRLAGPASDIK